MTLNSQALPPPVSASVRHSNAQRTVLVIEDDDLVRRVVVRTLEMAGYQVIQAPNGEAGLRILDDPSNDIDLILTDIDMPCIDGVTVTRVLAALRPQLPVICMSGTVQELGFLRALGVPAPPFLAKPFNLDELTRKTAEVLAMAAVAVSPVAAQHASTREWLVKGEFEGLVDAGRRLQQSVLAGGGLQSY
jgi:CheY-like chemotaxis protein